MLLARAHSVILMSRSTPMVVETAVLLPPEEFEFEVLMDFEGVVVERIGCIRTDDGVVVGRDPGMGTVPVRAGHQYLLGGARIADCRDAGIDHRQPFGGALAMGLVHQPVEDALAFELGCHPTPEIGEGRSRHLGCNPDLVGGAADVAEAVVVRVDHDHQAFGIRICDKRLEAPKLGTVEGPVQRWLHPLPLERDTDDLHLLEGVVIYLLVRRVDVVIPVTSVDHRSVFCPR